MAKKRARNDGNGTLDEQEILKRKGSRTRRAPGHLDMHETHHQARDETPALPAAVSSHFTSHDVASLSSLHLGF
jgi:hypothetical protein